MLIQDQFCCSKLMLSTAETRDKNALWCLLVSSQLLSLGGRSTVGIRHVVVGLRFSPGADFQPSPGAGVDLHRVQAMMQEMGATLSPGAQNLMEMVQFQQKVSECNRAVHLLLIFTLFCFLLHKENLPFST